MHRRLSIGAAALCTVAGLALSGCGGSNNGSSSSNGSSSGSSTANSGGSGGSPSDFCAQAQAALVKFRQLGQQFTFNPQQTPSVDTYKQVMATADQTFDSLDANPPSEIASAFHIFRQAFDRANAQIQSATTFDQVDTAFKGLDTASVKNAGNQIQAYLEHTCAITPVPSSS